MDCPTCMGRGVIREDMTGDTRTASDLMDELCYNGKIAFLTKLCPDCDGLGMACAQPRDVPENLPCKNKSIYVESDGSCMRCGAVQGEACLQP